MMNLEKPWHPQIHRAGRDRCRINFYGGDLPGKADIEHYDAKQHRKIEEMEKVPEQEVAEAAAILRDFGLEKTRVSL
jgi:hypothetical protein